MNFDILIIQAKAGEEGAIEMLLKMYQPLINKFSLVNGEFDEDLYQEQTLRFLICIKKFSINFVSICDKN